MNAKHLLTATALTFTTVALTAQPALAGTKLSVAGLGTATPSAAGHDYAGSLSGSPFSGSFTGALAATDGSLPTVGECEPGRANLRVQGPRGRYYDLTSNGQVCSWYLPLGVMQQFTGRWTVASTNVRRVARADGHLDIRILNGQSDVYAQDS
jgi:hypothetical protein